MSKDKQKMFPEMSDIILLIVCRQVLFIVT